jgi:hypothetical protein
LIEERREARSGSRSGLFVASSVMFDELGSESDIALAVGVEVAAELAATGR